MDMELLLSSVYIFPPLDEHIVEWIVACFSCHNTDFFSKTKKIKMVLFLGMCVLKGYCFFLI